MQFQPGQHVISNGTLYIFRHNATHTGDKPRVNGNTGAEYACSYAIVNLPNSDHPILMHRRAIKPVADTVSAEPRSTTAAIKPPAADVQTSKHRHFERLPVKIDGLAVLKADALDAQAERLEGYAKSLRTEARSLRGEG